MTEDISRRSFLKLAVQGLVAISGLLALDGLRRYLSFKPAPPPPKRFEIGPESDYPPGTRLVLPEIPAVLIHDQDGFHALSLVCTHLGCVVERQVDVYACNCHGSRYDKSGKVTRGPAIHSLPVFQVERNQDGRLVILKG